MGSQSAVMMKMAGEQWQYGKRRISAMSNEDFNKMTPEKLFQIETQELRAMIPLMEQSMKDMSALTPIIIKEMVKLVEDFIKIAPLEILKILGLEGVVTGKTPGELEYEQWLKSGGTGTPPPKSDFPSPTPDVKPKPTLEEIQEKAELTTQQLKDIAWQKFVGPGKSRGQIQNAIKAVEKVLNMRYKELKLKQDIYNKKQSQNNLAFLNKVKELINHLLEAIKLYKQALSWLLKNYPKKTP